MTRLPVLDYLLINHSPLGTTSRPDRFQIGAMWLQDLRAQAAAVRDAGGRLVVASPLWNPLPVAESGSFDLVEIDPDAEGFEYVPLVPYHSLRGWWSVRAENRRRIAAAIARSAIVHMGDGAHPIALDQIAWPLAAGRERVRVYVFDGADVIPRLEAHAASRRNPLKRAASRWLVRRREAFFRDAIREAELVFAHNASVVKRFADVWNDRCHFFDRSFVTEENLLRTEDQRRREQDLLDTSQPLRLVVAGRQVRIKGTDQVLRAMHRAAAQGVTLELDVFGEGEDLGSFRRLADELGLASRVRFQGTVAYGPELFQRLSRAQVMLVTNLTPEISRNVLLSMSIGLPLISYQNPGTDELISKNDAGVLVPSGDIEALGRALVEASRDRERLVTLLRNGRALAAANTLQSTHRKRAGLALDAARARLGTPAKTERDAVRARV